MFQSMMALISLHFAHSVRLRCMSRVHGDNTKQPLYTSILGSLVVQGSFCSGSTGSIALSCAHLFPCTMGKRGSHRALLKRPASNMCSIAGAVLSEAAVAELEATHKIADFRKSATALGLRIRCTQSRNFVPRDDILQECKRRLKEAHADDLNSITDQDVFFKRASKLKLKVKRNKAEGNKRCRKVDVVEDYRQQLEELPLSSGSASVPVDLTAVDLNSITDQTLTAGSD